VPEGIVAGVLTEPCGGVAGSEGELPGGVEDLLIAVAVRNLVLVTAHTDGGLSV